MCAYSMMADFAQEWIPQRTWTRPMLSEYQQIIDLLKSMDKKLGIPDCGEEEKTEFLKNIEKRLKALEDAQAI